MINNNLVLANISNGLAFPPCDDYCYFQSNYAHHAKTGYFAHNSISWKAIIHLLQAGDITIIDATRRHKPLSDALAKGCVVFALVFNRAIGTKEVRKIKTVSWQTPEMVRVANSAVHKPMVATIRKLIKYYGWAKPAIIGDNVKLICHQGFIADDKPERLKKLLTKPTQVNKVNDFAIFVKERIDLVH